ncbi:MAG: hypothetical protein J0M04_19940 [Verrucomicrobia bacterium]|nr:hypothetical protein [Verrucomicrobiota bacterium]
MPATPPLILITNCSATKQVAAGEPLMLRKWTGTIRQRFRWWTQAVERKVDLTPARHCYGGDAWTQVLAGERAAPDNRRLWIVSAGMGLISADVPIPNYSATFVSADPDSVGSENHSKVEWWNLLVKWRRKLTGIGCVTDLAIRNPESVFIVAVGSTYLSVIKNDLVSAREALTSPDNLLLISSGTRQMPALGSSLLPIDARFENLVGGARATLNARMLRHIVEKYKSQRISAPQVSKYLSNLTLSLAQPRSFKRQPLTDEQIITFIRNQSVLLQRSSASGLLRVLRDGGSACEQKRFHRIYKTLNPNQNEKSSQKIN